MIKVSGLTKYYGSKKAIEDISFELEDGKIYGFLGPNGAGKSTTMNIMTGYIGATSGTVEINGYDILDEPEKAKKNIGYLPEIPPLYPDMTVEEYLLFAAELKSVPRKERKAHVREIEEKTGISEVRGRLIKYLSKGYRQRVGFAQALVSYPDVIILDEPTVGLDPSQIIEIRKLIRSLSKSHSVIISSHILSEIQEIADRVVIINNGKIAAVDTLTDLSKRLSGQSKLLMSFRGPVKECSAKIRTLPGITSAVPRVADSKYSQLEIVIAGDNINSVKESIFFMMANSGWPILELRSLDPSLEEVFLNITSGKKRA